MARNPSGILEQVWTIWWVKQPSHTLTNKTLPLTDGDTVIGTPPLELWRVVLICKGKELGRVVMPESGWTHLELLDSTAYRVPGGGNLTYLNPSWVCRIFPTWARRGMVHQQVNTLDLTNFSKVLGVRIVLKLKNMGRKILKLIFNWIIPNWITPTWFMPTWLAPTQQTLNQKINMIWPTLIYYKNSCRGYNMSYSLLNVLWQHNPLHFL